MQEVQHKKNVVFFIGGAGDKSHYFPMKRITNITLNQCKRPLDALLRNHKHYHSIYLGFDEVFQDKIPVYVLPHIPEKENTIIHIVGHSLGAWNGAHLSRILSKKGYQVATLITLDAVGKGLLVKFSHLYWNTPRPVCGFWINILAAPDIPQRDDFIAWGGIKWKPSLKEVDLFHVANLHHREVGKMFREPTSLGVSAMEYLREKISQVINTT